MIIDSQRVYSALMKRVEQTKRDTISKYQVTDDSVQGIPHSPSLFSGNATLHRRTPSTIRCVQDTDDVFQVQTNRYDAFDNSSSESLVRHPQQISSRSGAPSESSETPGIENDEQDSPRRSHLGRRSESSITLSHRSSAFFASPTCHLFRTASPYRRALQESMKATAASEQKKPVESSYLTSLSALSLPLRRPGSAGSERDPRTAYAESVYSCQTEEGKLGSSQSKIPVSESFSQRPIHRNLGDVTIFVDKPAYKPNVAHKRDLSTASSVEWKTWLSANVAKLETPVPSPRMNTWEKNSFGLPSLGHVRENAEIESSGEAQSPGLYQSEAAKKFDGCYSGSSKKLLHKTSTRSFFTRDENDAPSKRGRSIFPASLRAFPSKSSLRSVPSLPLMKSQSNPNIPKDASRIPRMRSLNTISCLVSPRNEIILKRRSRTRLNGPGSSVRSSPGLTAAVERQFGQIATGSPAQRPGWLSHQPSTLRLVGSDGAEESPPTMGYAGSEPNVQAIGSKHMVDAFLSSRARRAYASEPGNGSSPAFI